MAAPEGHPVVSYQPIKLLFQLAYAGTVVLRMPIWAVVSLVTPLRPHPKWNAKQALLSRVAYVATDIKSRIGVTEKLSLEPGKEGERFQIVQPSELKVYKGPLESDVVKPAPVGGTWFPHAPKENIGPKTVILYLHGGAFIQGDGRDAYCEFPAKTMLERGGAEAVFSVQYRLSGWAGLCPFPAALQDALTAYEFLLGDLQIPPRHVVLCGDSAGANLAIALLRYISEFGVELGIPFPRCATLMSPWVAPLDYETEASTRRNSDFLPTSFLRWGALTYTAGHPNATKHAYITPLGNPFALPIPVFVNVGTAEILLDAIKLWVEEMKQVKDNHIELHQEDAALHDTFLVAELLGFEESAQKVVSAMGAFIRSH